MIIGKAKLFSDYNKCITQSCIFKSVVSEMDAVEKEILSINQKLVEGFGLPFGITQADYLYDKKRKKIYLCEIAARGGGVFISSDIIPMVTGIDVNKLLVDYVMGKDCLYDISKYQQKYAAFLTFSLSEGIIESINGMDEIKDLSAVVKIFDQRLRIGEQTVPLIDKAQRYGPILFQANSYGECKDAMQRVKKTLSIKVRSVQNKVVDGIIW